MIDKDNPAILLVEDEADAMAVLHEVVLSIEPAAQLIFAKDGKEALARLRDTQIDVVVADIMMPGLSGFDLLRTASEEARHQPFLFVTSLQGRDAAIQAIRLGAFDFIEKPLAKAKLAAPLAKAIRVSRAYQALEKEVDIGLVRGQSAGLQQAAQEILRLRALRAQKKP